MYLDTRDKGVAIEVVVELNFNTDKNWLVLKTDINEHAHLMHNHDISLRGSLRVLLLLLLLLLFLMQ